MLAFLVKTTNPLSSHSPASSPAPRPPPRASPRACSTPRTLRSTRTWRPCWRPPVSAGRAPRHWGFALAAGPAGVSASSFFLAIFLVARQPQGDPSTRGGPLAVPSQQKGSEDPGGISVLEVVSWGMGTQNNSPEVLRCGLQLEGVGSTSWRKLFPLPLSTWLPTHTAVFIPVFVVGHSWFMFSKWGIHDVVFSLFSTEALEGSNSNWRERALQHFRNHGREKGQEKDNEAFKISPAKL